jgi:hypothetical protein
VILFLALFRCAFLGGFKVRLGQINFHGDCKAIKSPEHSLKCLKICSFRLSLNELMGKEKNGLLVVRKLSSKKRKFSIVNGVDVILFLPLFRWAEVRS